MLQIDYGSRIKLNEMSVIINFKIQNKVSQVPENIGWNTIMYMLLYVYLVKVE